MGLNGPVARGAKSAKSRLFSAAAGAKSTFDVCPLADPGFVPRFPRRGYRVTEFNNVLVKRLARNGIVLTPRARRAVAGEADLWSYTVGRGFFEQPELTTRGDGRRPRHLRHARRDVLFRRPPRAGRLAAAAALRDSRRSGHLVRGQHRARFPPHGLHRELIAARLNERVARGCDLATASTLPGSGSQRNYERLGFQVVYTNV